MKRWKGYQRNGNEPKDQLDMGATIYFGRAIGYIRKESPQNADNVKQDILQKIGELSQTPEIHPADKYNQNNDGSYRCFEVHRYRISYLIKGREIIIARLRHTSQEPQQY